MKKIIFLVFVTVLSYAQSTTPRTARTYRTLTEACMRNQPGAGNAPEAIKFYAEKGGLVVGKTLWANNNPISRIKLRPGNYYVLQGNRAMKVDFFGKIENIITCENSTITPPEPQAFLLTTEPNKINWSQFGNFQNSFGIAQYGSGAPRFSDEKGIPNDPLSHGWTHISDVGVNTKALVPIEKSLAFLDINTALDMQIVTELLDAGMSDAVGLRTWTESLGAVSASTAYEAGRKLYYAGWGAWNPDTQGYSFRNGIISLVEQKWTGSAEQRGRIMERIIAGIKAEALSIGNFLVPQVFNSQFNACDGELVSGASSIPFSEQRFFPYHSNLEKTNFQSAKPIVQRYLSQTGIQVVDNFNFRVPFPLLETFYKKDVNGNYITLSGKRVFRDTDFTENQYGTAVNFYATPKNVSFYSGNNYLPEAWYATVQPFALYSHLVYSRQGLNKYFNSNVNITAKDNFSASLVASFRDETEPAYFSMTTQSRPISQYLAELQVYSTYLLGIKNFQIITKNGRRSAVNEPSGFTVKKYGENYLYMKNDVMVTEPKFWGTYEVYTNCLKYLQNIQTTYNIFSGSEQYFQCTQPADATYQAMIFGVISANNLIIFATDSRLDKEEQIKVTLTLSNQTGYAKTFNIKGREHYINVFQLPTGSYTTDNIRVQYNDLYGGLHKHTGNLQNPNW